MADSENNVNETPHFTYIWTVENMCAPCFVESPIFTVKQMEMTKWDITLRATSFLDAIALKIRRHKEDDGPNAIEIKFELSFLGIDGLPLIKNVDLKKFENKDFFEFREFAERPEVFFQKRAEFLPKDELTIRCRMWRTGIDIGQMNSCFARTRLRPDRHSFVWAVRDFTLQRVHERKTVLTNYPRNDLNFNLHVTEKNGEEYISISGEADVSDWIVLSICLLDFEGRVVHAVEKSWDSSDDLLLEKIFKKRMLINNTLSLLPNDVLELRFEMERRAKIVWSKIENYRYLNWENCRIESSNGEILHLEDISGVTSSLAEDVKCLQEAGTPSDVSLRTESKSFPAHKCILSARSPVFEAMFNRDMKKRTSNSVEIDDVDEDTLKELISYLYTDTVGELEWGRMIDLYKAADKYQLLDLKRRCATFLKSDLSVDSVCAVLCVADMHHDTELREAAEDFVMLLRDNFFKTDKWREFKVENSSLAFDTLERIVCNIGR